MIVIVGTSISFFVVGLPGNDMEGGGERHPGEPLRTLGLFVPKLGKQKVLARQNTTQAHKVKL